MQELKQWKSAEGALQNPEATFYVFSLETLNILCINHLFSGMAEYLC